MAAGTCKSTMNTALFAGTVFKGTGTHSGTSRAVKIQYFAQSAGNFSATAEGSSETTRVDSFSTFNARFGKLIDRSGYFRIFPEGGAAFQLTLPHGDPILSELQSRFGAAARHVKGQLF